MNKRTMWNNSAGIQLDCPNQSMSRESLISCNTTRMKMNQQRRIADDSGHEWLPLKKRRLSENVCNNGVIDLSFYSSEISSSVSAVSENVTMPLSEMNIDLPLDLSPIKKREEIVLNSPCSVDFTSENEESFIIDSAPSTGWNDLGRLSSALLLILKQIDGKSGGLEEASQLVFQAAAPGLMLETQADLFIPPSITNVFDPSFMTKKVGNFPQNSNLGNTCRLFVNPVKQEYGAPTSERSPGSLLTFSNNDLKPRLRIENDDVMEGADKKLCDCVVCDPYMINRNDSKFAEVEQERPAAKNSSGQDANKIADDDKSLEICYNYLLKLFPDADVEYMRNIAQKLHNRHKELFKFIEGNKKIPIYPRKDQFLAEFEETVKIFITHLDIENFLKIYPNPSDYFENRHRKCEFLKIGLDFLSFVFNSHLVRLIKIIYHENNYNLTLTAKTLARIGKDNFKRSSSRFEYPIDQLPLLHEMAYILHRKYIKSYLKEKMRTEKTEFEALKAQNALLKCQACFKIDCIIAQISKCENGHVFCDPCIRKKVELCLNRGEIFVGCFVDCGSEFSLSTLEKVLDSRKFQLLLKMRQAAEMMTGWPDFSISTKSITKDHQ